MATEAETGSDSLVGTRAIVNIPRWTLALGFLGAAISFLLRRSDWAAGIIFGALLAWLDFRWLRRGVVAMLAVPQGEPGAQTQPRNTGFSAFFALFRYVLIALLAYAIFRYLHVPRVSMAVGLCALGVATIAASVWEVLHPAK